MKRSLLLILLLGAAIGYGLGQWLGHSSPTVSRQASGPVTPPPPPMPKPMPSATEPSVVAAPRMPVHVAPLAAIAPAAGPVTANAAPNESPAWRRFAAHAPAVEGRPMLAVVIDDLGLQPKRIGQITALPGPLTLAFMPYGVDLPAQVNGARQRGHEILVHLPMEAINHEDAGPNALLVNLDRAETERRLRWALDRFGGYVGVNNHMGSKYTRDARAMAPVLEELKARGLLFLDSRTIPDSVGADEARRIGVPTAARDVFLDYDQAPDKVRNELDRAEALARKHGAAVAIGHPHDSTLSVLGERLPGMAARGIVLVPVSAIVARKLAG